MRCQRLNLDWQLVSQMPYQCTIALPHTWLFNIFIILLVYTYTTATPDHHQHAQIPQPLAQLCNPLMFQSLFQCLN